MCLPGRARGSAAGRSDGSLARQLRPARQRYWQGGGRSRHAGYAALMAALLWPHFKGLASDGVALEVTDRVSVSSLRMTLATPSAASHCCGRDGAIFGEPTVAARDDEES